jgi:hypothetical protein
MKFKKAILLLIIFLSLLGVGSMLSNIQSQEADQLLEAYGLSNNTCYFEVENKQTIGAFLVYLQKKYPKNKIQLHLANKNEPNQTLVWSNYNIINLPTESGRYFEVDDFKGRVTFAVLGLNSKAATLKTQGNQYLKLNNNYYSVIGTFKHYRQMKQTGYYLTTGPKQPTGQFKLKNYVIIIDSSPKVIRHLAAHYHVKAKVPAFVKKHQIHRFSIIREIIFMIFFGLIIMLCNVLLAMIEWATSKQTHLSGNLLNNLLVNRGIRIILIELLLTLSAYLFLNWRTFLSKQQHLFWLLSICWLVAFISYCYTLFYLWRKEKINA